MKGRRENDDAISYTAATRVIIFISLGLPSHIVKKRNCLIFLKANHLTLPRKELVIYSTVIYITHTVILNHVLEIKTHLSFRAGTRHWKSHHNSTPELSEKVTLSVIIYSVFVIYSTVIYITQQDFKSCAWI